MKGEPGEKSLLAFQPIGPVLDAYPADEAFIEKEEVTDAKLVKLFQREPGAAAELQKWDTWTFGRGGPTLRVGKVLGEADDKSPIKKLVDEDMARLGYHTHARFWNEQVLGRAVALLGISVNDGKKATDPLEKDERVPDVESINVITREAIVDGTGIKVGKDPAVAEEYGKITGYTLNVPEGDGTGKADFPAERFLHWARRGIVGDVWGESLLLPKYNAYRIRAKMRIALAQALRSHARRIIDVTVPTGTTDAVISKVETAIGNMDTLSAYIHEEDKPLKLHPTGAVLSPGQYVDFNDSDIAMGLGEVLFKGASAGDIASAEFNLKLFDAIIADWQRHAVTPNAYDAWIAWNIRHGRYPEAKYWWEWPSIRQTTEEEKANIHLILTQAFGSVAAGVGALALAQFTPLVDGTDILMVSPTGGMRIPIPGLKTTDLPRANARPITLLPGAHQKLDADLTMDQSEALNKQQLEEWEPHIKPLELEGATMWNMHFTKFQTDLLALLKDAWERHIGPTDAEAKAEAGTKSLPGQKDEIDFTEMMDSWVPKTASFETDAQTLIDNTMRQSFAETEELMGVKVSATDLPKDTAGLAKMRQKGALFAKDTILETNRKAQIAIRDAISGGSATTDYRQVTQKVSEILGKTSGTFPKTIHKILHEAASEARWDAIEEHTGTDEAVWVSTGDGKERTDPIDHGALNGSLISRAISMGGDYLAAFGCRCTVVPQSPYKKAVTFLKEQEAS